MRLPGSGRWGDWPAEALTLAASTSPDLVIVDLGLPDAGLAAVALLAGLTAAFARDRRHAPAISTQPPQVTHPGSNLAGFSGTTGRS